MRKNAQEDFEWKTQSKISCHYTWLLHGKNCPSRWRILRSFLTASKPSGSSITAGKRKGEKKIQKSKKSKDLGHFLFQNFDFCARPSQNAAKGDASGKRGKPSCCKCIFDQIQPENYQNVRKTQFWQKAPGAVSGLNCFWDSLWKGNN